MRDLSYVWSARLAEFRAVRQQGPVASTYPAAGWERTRSPAPMDSAHAPLIDFPVLRTLSFLRLLARRADLSAILPLHSRRSPVLVSRGCAAYRGVSLGYPAVRPIVLPFTAGDGWRFDAGRWITRGARRAVNRWFHSERSPRCSAWWGTPCPGCRSRRLTPLEEGRFWWLARTVQRCGARGKQVRGRAACKMLRRSAGTQPRRCGTRLSSPSHSVGAQRTFHDDVAACGFGAGCCDSAADGG